MIHLNTKKPDLQDRIQLLVSNPDWTRERFKNEIYKKTKLRITERTISRWMAGGKVSKTHSEIVEDFVEEMEEELSP